MSNKFANLDDDLMRAAMKKAISGFKATTGQEQNTGESGSTSQTTTKKQGYINPSKIDRVEEKLNYADRAIIPPVKKPTIPSNIVRQTPLLSEVQQYEDYYRQEQQRVQSNEKEKAKAKAKAKKIVRELSNYSGMKNHGRHVHIDQCKKLGLKVTDLEADQQFQDLVLTVHHAFMQTLGEAAHVTKIVENHDGIALVSSHASPATRNGG